MKTTLKSREEIEKMVHLFYQKVQTDEILATVFAHVEWSTHLPIMCNFWASMLLGENTYQGNPFQKHIHLPISSVHFTRWLELFNKTIDENFVGELADQAKERAHNIAKVFQHKLGLIQ